MKNNSISVKFISVENAFDTNIVISKSDGFVKFGKNNNIPQQLTDLYGSVSVHKGIISKKVNMLKAEGIDIQDCNTQKLNETLNFIDTLNNNDTFEQIIDKIFNDFVIYGGCYLQIIWNRRGDKINKVYHMPYDKMRSGIADNTGKINSYYYSPKGFKKYTRKSDVIEFEAFGNKNKKVPQIYYMKNYDVSNFYYSLPDYSSALYDLDTYKSISIFHNSNIHNGLQPSYIIMFKGVSPSKEKQDKIVKQIKEKYTDIQNTGKPFIFFLDNEESTELKTVESSDVDKMFDILSKTTLNNIVISHQIPKILANVTTEGSLGGSKEYIDAEYIFNKNYIKPLRASILSKINVIFKINNLCPITIQEEEVDLNKYTIDELLKIYNIEEIKQLLKLKIK